MSGLIAFSVHLIGVKVSKPLATVQGSLLALISSCRFLAVMSTARAGAASAVCVQRRRAGRRTVARDVGVRVGLGDVSAALANDKSKLD